MKRFKDLTEELFTEGGEMYPADEMTMKELKIACYAAQNILDRLEDGAMIQRWQISAIVKASEELASVYTSMSADEMDDEEWDDEIEEETDINEETKDLYVVKGKSPFYKQDHYLDTHSDPKQLVQRKIRQLVFLHAQYVNRQYGKIPVDQNKEYQRIYADWQAGHVTLEDIQTDINEYLKMRENAEKSGNVNKYKAEVVKVNEEVELDEGYNDPEYIRRAIPALKNAVEFHKDTMKDHDKKSVKGSAEYVRAHSAAANAHKEAAERHRIAHAQLSAGSKDIEYYVKPARELGAYAEKLSDKANRLKEELEEGYNDPIHRKYISDVVHEYVSKDDPKHEKIVDHLHQAKNFGNKTSDSLETNVDISTGAARRITKAVADHLKANFGGPSKPQTQAQRIGAYLKQKHIGPRSK